MKALQAVAVRDGVRVVYPHQVLCDGVRCLTTQERQALYYDDDHLSAAGVALVLPGIRDAVLH